MTQNKRPLKTKNEQLLKTTNEQLLKTPNEQLLNEQLLKRTESNCIELRYQNLTKFMNLMNIQLFRMFWIFQVVFFEKKKFARYSLRTNVFFVN